MSRPKLRIYFGPDEESTTTTSASSERSVKVCLREILPLLAEAYRNRRVWLEDFSNEQVSVSADLYDVLLAYENLHRPSA